MRRIIHFIICICLFSIVNPSNSFACTIFKVTKAGRTFVGNNEDGTDGTTHLWFLPASKGKFGRVYFTLSDKWPQGGMNDQGLFYDGTANPWKEVVKSSDKTVYNGNLSEKILEECSNVFEAIALLKKYNLNYFRNGQMFLTDRFGNSAIVEGDTIIYSNTNYQIATNFYHSDTELGGYPCHRYDITEAMVQNMSQLSMDAIRNILQAVHLDGYSFTQYSTIYELGNMKIQYFEDSDFSKYVEIDLKTELKEGERWFETKQFFQENPNKQVVMDNELNLQKPIKSYYENKRVKVSLNFLNNLLNGTCEGFYNNGQVSWRATFVNGQLIGKLNKWNEAGKSVTGYEFISEDKTDLIDYYPNGTLYLRVTLRKTSKLSLAPSAIIVFNQDGIISYSGTYKNGNLILKDETKPYSGVLYAYYDNRSVFKSIEYENGLLHGDIKIFDKRGNILTIEEFQKGILTRVKRF